MDDAFALSFLLKTGAAKISTIYSVSGNATADAGHLNNCELVRLLQHNISCVNGSSLGGFPAPVNGSNYLALGPLSNLAKFIEQGFKPEHIWMTLGRLQTQGRWPPIWPMEFNATKDLGALKKVFSSSFAQTIVPLDIAIKLRCHWQMKKSFISSITGQYLWENSSKWRWRNLLLKVKRSFPVWDLVSAICLIHPEAATIETGIAYLFANGLVICDAGGIPRTHHNRDKAVLKNNVKIVTNINQALMWELFFKALQSP